MATLAYSRIKRQLKQLSEKLLDVVSQTDATGRTAKEIINKIRMLLLELGPVVSKQELRQFLGAASVIIGIVSSLGLHAQYFSPPVLNPYGLTSVYQLSYPSTTDLDADGDMDIMVGDNVGNLLYFKNIATPVSPQYTAPITNPFGINKPPGFTSVPTFADLDGDGDQDLLVGHADYSMTSPLIYFKNTGTSNNPLFDSVFYQPYGLPKRIYPGNPTFVDIDSDGDQDLMIVENGGSFGYVENIGNTSSPFFAPIQFGAFGLPTWSALGYADFADVDGDGDLDMIAGEYYTGNLKYFRNNGTDTSPQFTSPVTNPFGLSSMVFANCNPTFSDIDGDGDEDLLVGEFGGGIQYFKTLSTGFGTPEPYGIDVQIYPNPVADEMELLTKEPLHKLEIFDVTGTLVDEHQNFGKTISISNLPNGSYQVKITNTDGHSVTRKIIKQ